MANRIKKNLKKVYGEIWDVLAIYEETDCYNIVPKHEELDIQEFLQWKLKEIKKYIDTLFLEMPEIAFKLHNIVDEVEYFTKKYEVPGVVLRWKQINNKLLFFDASFELLEELGTEEFLKIQRGLKPFKLQTALDADLIKERNKYFEEHKRKCKVFDVEFTEEKIFQRELLTTLTLVFLEDFGDVLDRRGQCIQGKDSYECLQLAHDLQKKFGTEKIIVLKGNHEAWFLDFLQDLGDEWFEEDEGYLTTRIFLTEEQMRDLDKLHHRDSRISFMKKNIKENHKELLTWLKKLPLYYETDTQIFVHAGVDEEIPEEELEWCTLGTGEWTFLGKYPPTTGRFYKDIIAGHVAAKLVAEDKSFEGVYFEGESHFYIDGSGGDGTSLLCLAYDENEKAYYDFRPDGTFKLLKYNKEENIQYKEKTSG